MTGKELYQLIGLQSEAVRKMEEAAKGVDLAGYGPCLEHLMEPQAAAGAFHCLSASLGEDPGNFKMLFCQLECARRDADRYREKGIPHNIFVDTMKCFPRFLKECQEKTGDLSFDRGWWTYRQVSMRIFRIGALEYELCDEQEHSVSLHIPSDADLSSASVDDSLMRAEAFFQAYYQEYSHVNYTCHSWMLSPVLPSLLPEESNIVSFQRRFDLIREDRETRDFVEWIFQRSEDADVGTLPERTRLQRGVKRLLLQGGTVGSTFGMMKKGWR